MKKILISLAAITLLVGCSSAKKTDTVNNMEATLSRVEQENSDVQEMIEGYKSEIESSKATITSLESDINAIDAFINPETVFDKDGVIIKQERDSLTLIMPTDVVFDFNKATIKKEFEPMLDTVAEALNIYTSLEVKIVSKGVDGNRVATEGFSFSKPIASNATQEGRDKNRRIEVILKK